MKKQAAVFNLLFRPESELEGIRTKAWELSCPSMTLKKRPSSSPATFSGSGLIRISNNGELTFKLFTSRERSIGDWRWDDKLKAGEIVPEDAFYDLVAIDSQGRKWTASRFLPSLNRSASGKIIAEGELFDLTCAGRFPREMQLGGSHLSYWFFGNIKIPCNTVTKVTKFVGHGRQESMSIELNAWKFRSCGFDFLLVKESDDLMKVEASTTRNRFPKYFEERVIESLHFLLGYPVPWSVMSVRTGRSVRTVIVGCRAVTVPSQSRLPLPTDLIIDNRTGKLTVAHHRRLFDRFLKHTLNYPKRRHPLWGKLNAVYEASAGTFIDAKALTLTVAIESLLENEFSELGKPSKREQRDIRNAITYMKEWNGPKRVKDRIGGSLSQLLRSRALDKLRELATRGAISEDEWKAWQALRNPSTHLYQSPHDSTESFIHLIEKVEVLFYHLIFYAIGYKGLYMDISLPDWPIRLYPLGKANASESSGSKH